MLKYLSQRTPKGTHQYNGHVSSYTYSLFEMVDFKAVKLVEQRLTLYDL